MTPGSRLGAVAQERAQNSAVAFAARPVFVVVALKCALELAVAGRYGWHRDELYYAVAGLHLQGGYVEFPPVTALLAAPSTPPERRRCRLRRCPADSQLRSDARRPLRSAVLGSRDHSQRAMGRGYMAVRTQLAAACARASHRPRLRFRRRFRAQSAGERV
jgi:hypothetical protein